LYYSPATLNNAYGYFKKNNSKNPISDSLKYCLPFMQKIMIEARTNMNKDENGIITIMLRDAAIIASEDPTQLNLFEINVLNKEEAFIKKRIK